MMTAVIGLVVVGLLAFFFFSSDNTVKTASAESAYAGVHMCDKGNAPPPATNVQSALPTPTSAANTNSSGAQIPKSVANDGEPYFAQNDPRWGTKEYAHAADPAFGGHDWCGNTIAQCGCAMTSVTTVMALFNLLVMPDGSNLTPESVNNWFNENATKTSRGWVSQGYSYGDVIWTAANQLSGEIAKTHPGATTIRYAGIGTGSNEEIRAQLKMGRPVVLEVPGHFIAAVGLQGDKILINDPFYRDRTTLDFYKGKVLSSRLFAPSKDLSAVLITAPADTRLKITDKQGRVVGTLDTTNPADAAKAAVVDIPGASYTNQAAWRDPTCVESAPPPGSGTNQIVLPGKADDYTIQALDTSGGATSVAIHTYGTDGQPSLTTIPVASGAATATMSYDPSKAHPTVTVLSDSVSQLSGSARSAGQPQTTGTASAAPSSPTAPAATPTAKPTVQTVAQTTVTVGSPAGSSVLNVASNAGFAIGDNIRISPGAANQEDAVIAGFGSFILKSPLKFGHSPGELVIKLGAGAQTNPAPPAPPPPAAQLSAPSSVAVNCSTVYNGVQPPPPGQPPPTATLICSSTIAGTYTTTRWTIDGQVQSQYTGKQVLLAVYNLDTTVGVAVSGCNVTLCTNATASQAIRFPVNTSVPAPTPTPPPAQGPIGPPPVVNTANIGCQPQPFTGNPNPVATLKCSSSTSMKNFTSVAFKATGTTSAGANSSGTVENFTLQVKPSEVTFDRSGTATVQVVVTYCQQATCATSDAYNWAIPKATVNLSLLPAVVQQGASLSLFAVVTTNSGVVPSGGSVSFQVGGQGFGSDVKVVPFTGFGFASLVFTLPDHIDPNLPFGTLSPPDVAVTAVYNGGSNAFPSDPSAPVSVTVTPPVPEACDSLDNNENGIIDEGCPLPGVGTNPKLKDIGNGTELNLIALSGSTLPTTTDGGAAITVRPGQTFTLNAIALRKTPDATSDYCANCTRQIYFGIGANTAANPQTPAIPPIGGTISGTCAMSQDLTAFPDSTPTNGQPLTVQFAAPTTPGVFYVRATSSLQPACGQPAIGGPDASIARVVVQATTTTTMTAATLPDTTLGTRVTMSAEVKVNGSPTGTISGYVEFCDSDTPASTPSAPCGTAAVLTTVPVVPTPGSAADDGTATFTLDTSLLYDPTNSPSPIKTHHFTAHFVDSPPAGVFPIAFYSASDSPSATPTTLNVKPSTTTIQVTVTPGSTALGGSVVLAVGLASSPQFGTLSGTIDFLIDGTVVHTSPVAQSGLTLASYTYDTSALYPGTAPVGPHNVTAKYNPLAGPPASNYAAATTASPATLTTTPAATGAQLTITPANPTLGTSVTVSMMVFGPAFGPIGSADGQVTFQNGTDPTFTGTLQSSPSCPPPTVNCSIWTATFNTGSLYPGHTPPTGPFNFTAVFTPPANSNYLGAAATPATMTVAQAVTTTAINISGSQLNPSLGDTITVTAQVTSTDGNFGTFGGTVTFEEGTNVIGTGAVSTTGQATCACDTSKFYPGGPAPVGPHQLTAVFSGSGNYAPSTSSSSSTINVGQAATTMTLGVDTTPQVLGQPVTLTATITAPASQKFGPFSGTITFKDNGASIGTAPLTADGVATLTVDSAALPNAQGFSVRAGAHPLTADYAGQTNYASATASTTLTLTAAPVTVTIAAAPSTSSTGNSVTFTATVTSAVSGTISGNVDFCDSGTGTGNGSCSTKLNSSAVALDNTGHATFSTSSLTPGVHNVFAQFTGAPGGDYQSGKSSANGTVTVLNPTATVVTPPANINTTTNINVSVAVTCPSCSGSPSINGSAEIFVDGGTTAAGTIPISSGSGSGTIGTMIRGSHTLFARFHDTSVSPAYASSDSPSVPFTVYSNTTTTLTAPANNSTITAGTPTTFTASVTAADASSVGEGDVEFWLVGGLTPLATTPTVSGGTASASITFPTAGTQQVYAKYVDSGGSATYNGSQSGNSTYTVKYTTTLTVTGNTTVTALDTDTYTATLTYSGGTATAATGTVTFTVDGAAQAPVSVASGVATLPGWLWHYVSSSGHTVTASYSGDTAYLSSSSATLNVTVSQITTSFAPLTQSGGVVTATISCSNGDCTKLTGSVLFTNSGTGPGTQTGSVTSGTQATATGTFPSSAGRSVTAALTSTNSDFAASSQTTPVVW